jgi:hypothetical protein
LKAKKANKGFSEKNGQVLIADSEFNKCSVVGIYSQGAGAK